MVYMGRDYGVHGVCGERATWELQVVQICIYDTIGHNCLLHVINGSCGKHV